MTVSPWLTFEKLKELSTQTTDLENNVNTIIRSAQTFYINSATGDDSNDGLSPATAWQTFAAFVTWQSDKEFDPGLINEVNFADGTYAMTTLDRRSKASIMTFDLVGGNNQDDVILNGTIRFNGKLCCFATGVTTNSNVTIDDTAEIFFEDSWFDLSATVLTSTRFARGFIDNCDLVESFGGNRSSNAFSADSQAQIFIDNLNVVNAKNNTSAWVRASGSSSITYRGTISGAATTGTSAEATGNSTVNESGNTGILGDGTVITDGGSIALNKVNYPAFDGDAAAGVGGLIAGELYQTTGLGAAPLNVAGIVVVKQ